MRSLGEDRYYQVPEEPEDNDRVYTCDWCGGGIYVDETYYLINKEYVCAECIERRERLA